MKTLNPERPSGLSFKEDVLIGSNESILLAFL
jgi:hypothetical protein